MLTLEDRVTFRSLQAEQDNMVIEAMEAMLSQGILARPNGTAELVRDLTPVVTSAAHLSASTGSALYSAGRINALGRAGASFIANPVVRVGLTLAVQGTIAWGANEIVKRGGTREAVSDLRGGLTRHVRSGARTTLEQAIQDDPESPRYRRVPRAGGCEWCLMLASRGYVYASKGTALVSAGMGGESLVGDRYHDYCSCTAEAQFKNERPPEFVQHLESEWRRINWVNGKPAYPADVARDNWYQFVHMGGLGDRPKPKPVGRPSILTND